MGGRKELSQELYYAHLGSRDIFALIEQTVLTLKNDLQTLHKLVTEYIIITLLLHFVL